MAKINKSISQAPDKPNSMSSLRTKLKTADSEIQNYVIALEKENLKLQREIAKYQVQHVTLENRIKILEEENSKGDIILHVHSPKDKKD
jgi:predicted MPP superfamily phosphohydrolase